MGSNEAYGVSTMKMAKNMYKYDIDFQLSTFNVPLPPHPFPLTRSRNVSPYVDMDPAPIRDDTDDGHYEKIDDALEQIMVSNPLYERVT